MPLAAFLAGKNLGYREGIEVKYGGPGSFRNAIVEWQDYSERKVVVYLNSGANGYAFWLKLDPGFAHYTYAAKIFTCDNESDPSIKEAMEKARDWCKNEWDGGDTRITGGDLKPRSDDGDLSAESDKDPFSREALQNRDTAEALRQAREDIANLVLERDRLRKKLGTE